MVDEPQRPTESRHVLLSKGVGTFLLSAGFISILGLLVAAFQIAGVVSVGLAHLLIALAWVIAVFAVWGWLLSRPRKHTGKIVLLTALVLGLIFLGLDIVMVRLKAEQERRPPPSVGEWLLPVTTYIQSLPWRWVVISLAVGFLFATWLFRGLWHGKTENKAKKQQDRITELEGEKSSLEERIGTLHAQHQSEKDRLEGQIEGSNREVDRLKSEVETQEVRVSARQGEVDSLRAKLDGYKWLQEIAETQAADISRYVTLERVMMLDPHDATPSRNFYFYIRNQSNYHITIDDKVGGAILFEGKPLTYPLTVLGNELKECPPSAVGILTISQPLRPEEADRLSRFEDNVYYYFLVNQLHIYIKGGENFPQVKTQRLMIKDLPPDPPAQDVKKLTDRIKELERGKAALEKEKSDTVGRLGSELEAFKNRYGWLHEMADAQARDIDKCVIVERFHLLGKVLTGDDPYIEFWVDIYNMSVFDLMLDTDAMEGHIIFSGERLRAGKKISYLQDTIPPSTSQHFNLKQYLTEREGRLIAKYTNEELVRLIHIHDLGITISGGAQFPQVERRRLKLPSDISVSAEAKEAEVAALRTQVVTLQSELESLSAVGPNLVFLHAQVNVVHIDDKGVIQSGGAGDRTLTAVIAKFENKADPPRKVSPAKSVIAHISYEVGGQAYSYSIDKGAWVDEEYSQVDFEVGDTRRLMIAAVMSVGNSVVNYQNNNDSPDRRDKPTVMPLRDSDQFIVEVELIVRGSSEAGRKFRFKLTLRPTLLLELIDS